MKHNKVFTFLSGITLGAVLMVSIVGLTPKIYSANKTIPALIDTGNKVFVDGVEKPTPAGYYLLNIDGRIYAPLRYVGESTGNTIDYIAANKFITIKTSAQSIKDAEAKIKAEYEEKYSKKLKDKELELKRLKDKYEDLEKSYKNDKAKYEKTPNISKQVAGKTYSSLPIVRNFNKFKIKLSTIMEDKEGEKYSTFYFKIKNDSGHGFEIDQDSAELTYVNKVGATETLREIDTIPTYREVSAIGVIRDEEEKTVGITMPTLPEDCRYAVFTMDVHDIRDEKTYKFEVNIDLDRDTMSNQDNDWDF